VKKMEGGEGWSLSLLFIVAIFRSGGDFQVEGKE
jgi:hypothetical protein